MFLREQVRWFTESGSFPESPEFQFICSLFETALSSLSKMPRLWIMYLEFTVQNRSITLFRRVLNRALQALPVTQHQRIWDIALNKLIYQSDFPVPITTCKALLRRYIQLDPTANDQFIDFLLEREDFSDAVEELIRSIKAQDEPSSLTYFKLITVLSKNSNKLTSSLIASVDLPGMIRAGLARFPDELGNLWNHLADYYIRMGMFGRAIEVYEEAIGTLTTVSDFSIVFNSYQNFLDLVVKLKMESGADIEMDLDRLELLIERRPELLSSVLLRQNPHNVIEWIKRTKLPRFSPDQVVAIFTESLMTVDVNSKNLVGRVSTLWCEFAKYYFVSLQDPTNGRKIFEKAIYYSFKTVDDLANVWIEWILLELKAAIVDVDSPEDSRWLIVLETARRAISHYRGAEKGSVQSQLFRSVKLWNLALDIEESFNGTKAPELVRAIYATMIELRVITPALILSYAQLELKNNAFDKAIRVLEKGVDMFPWPYCREIWLYYLNLVVNKTVVLGQTSLTRKRKSSLSTERVRDLFEQVISDCPGKFVTPFLFMFFKFELEKGLARTCINVLVRGASHADITPHERAQFFYMAVAETWRLLGAGATRKLFEQAIETFTNLKLENILIEFCIQFSNVETQIGEIERARKLFQHASQFANPNNKELEYLWDLWRDFEIQNGDEETYKEMKRVRRSVDVLYSDKHFNTLDAGMAVEIVGEAQRAIPETPSGGGIDLSKLLQSAAEYGSNEDYIPSASFTGTRPGYVFTTRVKGTGYYRE